MRNNLTRLEIIHALVALDAECEKQGIAGEICIYGGAGMVLFRRVGIRSEEQALEIVERFFPKERIHIKTHYFISENLELLKQSEGSEP